MKIKVKINLLIILSELSYHDGKEKLSQYMSCPNDLIIQMLGIDHWKKCVAFVCHLCIEN